MLAPLDVVPSRQNPSTFSDDMDAFLNWLLTVYLPWANSIENSFQFTSTNGTSSTSLAITTGSKTLVAQNNKAWVVGSFVYLVYSADVSKLMVGQVTAYNNGTGALTVNVISTLGSGTFADWSIGLATPSASSASYSGAVAASSFQLDATCSLLLSGSNPLLQFDTNDYISYDRTGNIFKIRIGGIEKFSVDSTDGPQRITDAATGDGLVRKSQVETLIAVPATNSQRGTVLLADNPTAVAGTDATKALTSASMHAGKMVTSAVQATTSGTLVDFTGIPSWARRLTLMMKGVSTNGSADFLVRLGTGAGFTATGYSSYYSYLVNDTNAATAGSTVGLGISSGSPVASFNGIVSIVLMDASTNSWVSSHCGGDSGGTSVKQGGGSVSLPGVLTSLRFMTANGTDTFDGGSISLMWE